MGCIAQGILELFSTRDIRDNLLKRTGLDVYREEDKDDIIFAEKDNNARYRYLEIMGNAVFSAVHYGGEDNEKRRSILNLYRRVISSDLSSSLIAEIAYKTGKIEGAIPNIPTCIKKKGEEIVIPRKETFIELSDKYLLGFVPKDGKLFEYYSSDKIYEKDELTEHPLRYFPSLNILLLDGGDRHKTTAAHIKRENKALAHVWEYDDRMLCEILKTDGAFWLDMKTGERVGRTGNFRISLIFTLYQLERGILSVDEIHKNYSLN